MADTQDETSARLYGLLQAHQDWVRSNGSEGQCADLIGTGNTSLRHRDLTYMDLEKVIGLTRRHLAGCDLTGTKLPGDLAEFDGLRIVEELSKTAGKFLLGLLTACAYSLITIWTNTAATLVTNSATSALPVIGSTVPILGFYLLTPFLLVGAYIYFHMQLSPALGRDQRTAGDLSGWALARKTRCTGYFERFCARPQPAPHNRPGQSACKTSLFPKSARYFSGLVDRPPDADHFLVALRLLSSMELDGLARSLDRAWNISRRVLLQSGHHNAEGLLPAGERLL